jgi:uncharacterized membrane protein YeaQ/YmgE (transglycosylase-associated protein family)
MGIVSWIIIGLVTGWAAGQLLRRTGGGDLALNLVVGVVGAAAGGFITNLVIRQPVLSLNLQNGFVATLAAVVFLAIGNALRSR